MTRLVGLLVLSATPAALAQMSTPPEADLTPGTRFPDRHRIEGSGRSLCGVSARYDDPEWELPLEAGFMGMIGGGLEGTFCAAGTQIDTARQSGGRWATKISDRHADRTP